jgi:hypothetical protein
MKTVSIILPTLNEEEAIGSVIDEIPKKEIEDMGYNVETLIVDNNSKDRTRIIAKKSGAKLIIEPRKGYGRAYKTGFKLAKGEIIVTADSDFTYPMRIIPAVIKMLEKENLDFINTNRFTGKGYMQFTRKFGNKILTFFTHLLFGIKIKDSQSGMWIFKKDILNKLNLKSDGFPFSEEFKIEACVKKLKIKEIPIKYRKRLGQSKIKDFKDGIMNLIFLFVKRINN